jgi:2,3-diaminopropionate biosynthesis protein SbnB
MFEFLLINGKEISEIIRNNYQQIIQIVSSAYVEHSNGNAINPDTYFLTFPKKPNARISALPAYLAKDVNLAGIKWIASFPDNIKKGIPRASAILLLNDFETGYPIACMEGSIISAARTAASAVLGASIFSSTEYNGSQDIAFIGNGIISKYIFDFFIGSGWKFNSINLFDINKTYSYNFLKYIKNISDLTINICNSLDEACKKSNIIVLATNATKPYINNKNLFSHNPIILNISLRDLDPEIILQGINIVDDIDHCLKADTSLHLASIKSGNRNFVHNMIGRILANNIKIDNKDQLVIYSPFGMGILYQVAIYK